MAQVTLSNSVRFSLLSLQSNAAQLSRSQERLSSGLAVDSGLDNPTNFFTAQDLNSRAGDLAALADGVTSAVQTIAAADKGITGIARLVESAQATARQALEAPATLAGGGPNPRRAELVATYNIILEQIGAVARDASYKGVSLLTGDNLAVPFNEDGSSKLTIEGVDDSPTGLGLVTLVSTAFDSDATIRATLGDLEAALGTLRIQSSRLGANLSVAETRQVFMANMADVLVKGAANLTLANADSEGANVLALQTRQQLGSTALSLASQADQNVLRLF